MFSTARAVFTISLLSLPGTALAQAGPSEAQIIAGASTSKINVGARKLAGQMVATLRVGDDGRVRPASGWTDLVVDSSHPVRAVGGLLTGLHAPEASHLLLLEAVAGAELVGAAYEAAVARRYRWHEFGDSHLILT